MNVDQALADVAHFVDHQRSNLRNATKAGVIVVGASYSATLATWFRQQYQDKANGAWASSAPLQAQLDMAEYKEVVSRSIEKVGSAACSDRIAAAFTKLDQDIARGEVAGLMDTLNLCDHIQANADEWHVRHFFSVLSDEFAALVQFHNSGDIESACHIITNATITDPVEAVGQWIKKTKEKCLDTVYKDYIEEHSDHSFSSDKTIRLWTYQTCNEFGWYSTSSSLEQLFGTHFPLDLYIRHCAELFDNQ